MARTQSFPLIFIRIRMENPLKQHHNGTFKLYDTQTNEKQNKKTYAFILVEDFGLELVQVKGFQWTTSVLLSNSIIYLITSF